MPQTRFSELSGERQGFIRQCQRLGFGRIVGLVVRDSQPLFGPGTLVLMDVKLDSAETRRPELDLNDFVLSAAMLRLFDRLDLIGNGRVDLIEVSHGVPLRMQIKTVVQE